MQAPGGLLRRRRRWIRRQAGQARAVATAHLAAGGHGLVRRQRRPQLQAGVDAGWALEVVTAVDAEPGGPERGFFPTKRGFFLF